MAYKLISLLVLFISVILHEIAHGAAALYFGDDTAKREGRLSLDPIVHVDILGTIVVPLLCTLTGSPVFGWAKPVSVDFNSLPNKRAELCVTLAGIAVNFSLAIIAAIGIRIVSSSAVNGYFAMLVDVFLTVMYVNLLLAVFNLMPVPPLDGWRIWGVWLPEDLRMKIEMNSMIAMILLFLTLPLLMRVLVSPIMGLLVRVLAGV